MIEYADLHLHTNFSDSTLTPAEIIIEAKRCGIGCVAITDHDTVDGILPAMETAKAENVEVIPGIELSGEAGGREIHILGYFFDFQSPDFQKQLTLMQDTRVSRMARMIEKLKELGVNNITLEEVCSSGDTTSVGRVHLAMILKEKKWVKTIQEAFDKYLQDGAPAYVPKYRQSPEEAIAFIRRFGGAAVLAHPMLTLVDEMIPQMARDGLAGLEVYYPNVSTAVINFYERIAHKHNLLLTGGSDAHGLAKDNTRIGRVKLPYHFVETMKERLKVV